MREHAGHGIVLLAVLAFAAWVALAARSPRQPAAAPRDRGAPPVRALALASVLARLCHAWATPHHLEENLFYGVFFVSVTLGQFAWAGAIWRPGRPVVGLLAIALIGNVAVLATWGLSRTVGVFFGSHRTPEPVGVVDLTASAAELLLVALATVWLLLRATDSTASLVPPDPTVVGEAPAKTGGLRSPFPD